MAGLVPAIHAFICSPGGMTAMMDLQNVYDL
jgi:hypothetical protein